MAFRAAVRAAAPPFSALCTICQCTRLRLGDGRPVRIARPVGKSDPARLSHPAPQMPTAYAARDIVTGRMAMAPGADGAVRAIVP